MYQFSGIFASGLTPIIGTALLPLGDNKPDLRSCSRGEHNQCHLDYAMAESHKRDMAVDNKAAKLT